MSTTYLSKGYYIPFELTPYTKTFMESLLVVKLPNTFIRYLVYDLTNSLTYDRDLINETFVEDKIINYPGIDLDDRKYKIICLSANIYFELLSEYWRCYLNLKTPIKDKWGRTIYASHYLYNMIDYDIILGNALFE